MIDIVLNKLLDSSIMLVISFIFITVRRIPFSLTKLTEFSFTEMLRGKTKRNSKTMKAIKLEITNPQ